MAKPERVTPYGLKEVADVYFFPVGTYVDVSSSYTVSTATGYICDYIHAYTSSNKQTAATANFVFDTLKVSNIEVSSEDTSATGGKGNPELISWSYGKEITFTMEDAVFNLSTLDLMFGASSSVSDKTNTVITINSDTFSENYCMVGTTYLRSQENGKDYPFIFEIPNGKVQTNGTLTMEADGDPTTFEMTIKALKKSGSKELVKFTRLNVASDSATHASENVG